MAVGFLSLLLILSAVDKLFHYSGFVNAVRNYVLVPPGTADFLAPPVIVGELLLGIGLLSPRTRRVAAALSCLLFIVFLAALALNLRYGERGICGCWFTITVSSGPLHLLQNFILAVLAGMTWWSEVRPASSISAQDRARATSSCNETTST